MKKEFSILFFLLFVAANSFGQEEKIYTNNGNKSLQAGNYEEAEKAYKKALETDPDFKEAQFNLGNTYQAQARAVLNEASKTEDQQAQQEMLKKVKELSASAASAFEKVNATEDSEINKTQYNLGNSRIMTGEVDKSIESYKEALRHDPNDEDARYNLAYAQYLKKKQEEQQKQDQDNKEEDQDQQENEENKEEQKEDQKKDDQNKDNQDQQDKKQQQQQQQQLSKEEAEKMLEALMRQEKDLQEKLNKKKQKGERIKIEKDW